MSAYETYVEGLGDTIPVNRVSLELAAILLEYAQEMADPRISSGRWIELAWRLPGGVGEAVRRRRGVGRAERAFHVGRGRGRAP